MTLTELKYVIAVAREHHFGRAAESCGVSQPSLSVAIRKLEEELGVSIFERRSSEIALTPVGEKIVEQAQRVMEESRRIADIAHEGQDPLSGPIKLGVIYTIGPYLLPELIRELSSDQPNMPVYLEENFTSELLERLKTGQLDLAIMADTIADTISSVLSAKRHTHFAPSGENTVSVGTVSAQTPSAKMRSCPTISGGGAISAAGRERANAARARSPVHSMNGPRLCARCKRLILFLYPVCPP